MSDYYPRTFGTQVGGDSYGRHALPYAGAKGDVLHLLPTGTGINPVRLDSDYVPRHAGEGGRRIPDSKYGLCLGCRQPRLLVNGFCYDDAPVSQ